MPPRISPNDWDTLFRPNAPRRGGPLRALANLTLIGIVVALLGGGAFFGLRFGLDYAQESAAKTAVAVQTTNARIIATRTARALEETAAAAAPPPAVATPTAEAAQAIGRSSVVSGGNLRSEPVIVPETVIGQICAGDQVDVLEERAADGATWYRIRITEAPEACTPQRVSIGSIGWASATLLAPVAP